MADPTPRLRTARRAGRGESRGRGRGIGALGFLAMLSLLASALLGPGAALAVPRPGESCPDTTPAPGSSQESCAEGGGSEDGGGGTPDLGGVLPILAAAVGGAAIALVAAFVVLRRRASAPVAPADPGEWWTCPSCGKANVIGSPRCYACGSWQA